MELSVLSAGKAASKMTISDDIFTRDFNETLVHQVVTAHLAGARQGSKAQKSRSDCRGGGAKPWRQKGTGRARAGTNRSPLWRSGGVTFAARPRDYSKKVNRKAHRSAMSSILSELIRQERLLVVDAMTVSAPKTKELVEQLKLLSVQRVLLVTADYDANLTLSARNIPNVHVSTMSELSPVELISVDHVVITVDALQQLAEKLS
jgi:large subunit ribosomal protein L4